MKTEVVVIAKTEDVANVVDLADAVILRPTTNGTRRIAEAMAVIGDASERRKRELKVDIRKKEDNDRSSPE